MLWPEFFKSLDFSAVVYCVDAASYMEANPDIEMLRIDRCELRNIIESPSLYDTDLVVYLNYGKLKRPNDADVCRLQDGKLLDRLGILKESNYEFFDGSQDRKVTTGIARIMVWFSEANLLRHSLQSPNWDRAKLEHSVCNEFACKRIDAA